EGHRLAVDRAEPDAPEVLRHGPSLRRRRRVGPEPGGSAGASPGGGEGVVVGGVRPPRCPAARGFGCSAEPLVTNLRGGWFVSSETLPHRPQDRPARILKIR